MRCKDLRFLLVEDHEFQLRMQVRLLTSLGARLVHTARNGEAALEVLRDPARPVDVVIFDLAMPTMDGVEFVRNLKGCRDRLSLIVNSGLKPGLVEALIGVMDAQAIPLLGWIEKPLTAEKLAPLLEKHRSRFEDGSRPPPAK